MWFTVLQFILFASLITIGSIGFINSKKHKLFFAIIISLVLAFTAYSFVPGLNDDLYRHHLEVYSYMDMQNTELFDVLLSSSEKGETLTKIIVSRIGNVNYLQFGITFLTYLLLFYIINLISSNTKCGKISLFLLVLFIMSTVNYIGIISNLYFTFSIVLFCLAIYKFYSEKKIKSSILLFTISFFLHSSMTVAIFIFVIFLLCKNKMNYKAIIILIVFLLSLNEMIPWLYNNINNNFTIKLYSYYYSYILDTYNISDLHSFNQMTLYYSKVIPFALLFLYNKRNDTAIDSFTKYSLIFIILMGVLTTFSIRFIPIITILGSNKIINYMESTDKKYNKSKIAYIAILLAIIIPNIIYQYKQITSIMIFN